MMDESLQRAMKLTHEQKILLRLVHGELVTKGDLIDLVWGDDPDGGPMFAENSFHVSIGTLKERLNREGWDIEVVKGYALGLGKGPVRKGCRNTKQGSRGSRRTTSRQTGAGSSPAMNSGPSLKASGVRCPTTPPSRPSQSHGLTDFLSKPSQPTAL
jgi:hypothetical protein